MEMESTWYLAPGQSLENTKIEDRGHALRVTKNAWSKITKHLDRKRLLQEAIDKEQAHKEALKKGSEEMTKNWDNSVENIRIRKEEDRLARIQKTKDERMERFLELRKQQAALRDKFVADARKTAYISKGPLKELTGALLLSEVLYEREKQIAFDKKIKEHEQEEVEKEAQKIWENARQEVLEKEAKKEEQLKKSLELRDLYLKTMKEKQESYKKEREDRIKQEQRDIVQMEKEFAEIKKIEHEQELEKRAGVKKEFNDFLAKQKLAKEQIDQEDKEQDQVIDIYSKAKFRIECLRKKKVEEMQRAMILKREAASKQAVAEAKAKFENEERILKKAEEEREKEELEKLRIKAAFREQLIKDRQEERVKEQKREENRKFEEEELRKWQMLNKMKVDDVTKQYIIDKQNRLWQETLQYRRDLFDQMAEKEKERQQEKEETDEIYKYGIAKVVEEDKKFFDYADEVFEHAKKRGRKIFPITRVVDEYKRTNNLAKPAPRVCERYEPDCSKN